jgi:hypothetical protein
MLIKMISQIVSYFANQKDHPSHNSGFKLTCRDWQSGLLTPIILSFLIEFFNKKIYFYNIVQLKHSWKVNG